MENTVVAYGQKISETPLNKHEMIVYAYFLFIVGIVFTSITLFFENRKASRWIQFVAKTCLAFSILFFTQTRRHKHMAMIAFMLTILPATVLFMETQDTKLPDWLEQTWTGYRMGLFVVLAVFVARFIHYRQHYKTSKATRLAARRVR